MVFISLSITIDGSDKLGPEPKIIIKLLTVPSPARVRGVQAFNSVEQSTV
jgi:hypothetical protein